MASRLRSSSSTTSTRARSTAAAAGISSGAAVGTTLGAAAAGLVAAMLLLGGPLQRGPARPNRILARSRDPHAQQRKQQVDVHGLGDIV